MDSSAQNPYSRAMFRTGAQMSLLVLLTGLFLLWASRFPPVQAWEDGLGSRLAQAYGWGQQMMAGKGKPLPNIAPVALIAINDSSLENHPWPWTPLDYSLFVQAATAFKPEVVAIDEVLDWDYNKLARTDRQKQPQYEKILRDSLLRCPKVLLGAQLGQPEDPDAVPPLQGAPILKHVKGDPQAVPEWPVIEREPKEEFRLSAALGFTNLRATGHTIHAAPLLLRSQGSLVPTMVLQAILLWQRMSLDDVSVVLGSQVAIGEKLRIPIDARGEMRVNFGTPFTRIGFDELLLSNEQTINKVKVLAPVERLARSVTLLARTDKQAEKVPLGSGVAGTPGELFAAAIATIQNQAFLHLAPGWVSWVLVGLAVVVALGVPVWKKKKVALWGLVAVLAYGLLALVLFATRQVFLPTVLPLGLALFIVLYRLATPNNVWKLKRPVIL